MIKSQCINWIKKTALKDELLKVADEVSLTMDKGVTKKAIQDAFIKAIDEDHLDMKEMSEAIKVHTPKKTWGQWLFRGKSGKEILKKGAVGAGLITAGAVGAGILNKMGAAVSMGNVDEGGEAITDDESQM